jgi:hypothetical protein
MGKYRMFGRTLTLSQPSAASLFCRRIRRTLARDKVCFDRS